MTFYADSVFRVRAVNTPSGAVWRGRTNKPGVQCYLSGSLVDFQEPNANGDVEFRLSAILPRDIVFLLAVDLADADIDHFDEAFPEAAANGNRLTISVVQDLDYDIGDVIKMYVGPIEEAEATDLVFTRDIFPSGRAAGGWGFNWGINWGLGPLGVGWGINWGINWGIGTGAIEFQTGPLIRGDWPVKVTVEDAAGNVSTAFESIETLDTFARPATDLAIESYTKIGDTLVLTFTPSEDL